MAHQGQLYHTLLIGHTVLIWKELFSCLFLLTIAQADTIFADSLYDNAIQIIINGAKTLTHMKRESLPRIVSTCQFHVDTITLNGRKHLNFFFSLLSSWQFQMLFGNALDESQIERICGIKVINQFLIILHRMFVLAFTDRKLWKGSTIAQHQLRSEILNKSGIRLAATLHTMWLVDNQHRLGVSNSINRSMKFTQHLVIVLTGQQLTVSNELRIKQQHINLMLCMMSAVKEMSHGRRHIQTSLFLLLLRFKQAQLYLCIVVAHHLKVAFHFLLL